MGPIRGIDHTIKIGNKTYHRAACDSFGGNLIQGVNDVDHYIYLYYTKDCDPNDDVNNSTMCHRTAVTSVDVISKNRDNYEDFRLIDGYVERYDSWNQSLSGEVADCNYGVDSNYAFDSTSLIDPNAVVIKMNKDGGNISLHNLVKQDYVAPTSGADGRLEHYRCSVCNKLYMDIHCEYEVRQSSVIIPAPGKEPTPETVEGNQRIFNNVEFMSDIFVASGSETLSGYKKYDVNLNKGNGSSTKIYLWYKPTTNIDEAITDVIIVSEPHGSHEYEYNGSSSKIITDNGRTFRPAMATWNTGYGNLNYGASNDRYNNLYIFYTKDSNIDINNTGVCYHTPLMGLKPIVDNSSESFEKRYYGYVKKYDAETAQLTPNTADCNENAGGDWVSIWKETAPAMIMSHEVVKHDHVDQTCTVDGNKDYYQCKYCHRNYGDKICTWDYSKMGIALPALGGDHQLELVPRMEASCEAGCIEHYQCVRCYALYSDDEGKNRLTEEEVKIPGLGHIWKPVPIKYDAEKEEYTLECARDVNHEEIRKQLCLHSQDDNALITVKHNGNSNPDLKYSKNGEEWKDFPSEGVRIDKTDLLWLKGFNPNGFSTSDNDYTTIYFKNRIYATGSVMSLTDELGDSEEINAPYCFSHLFSNCELAKAPRLPATILREYCYSSMFEGAFLKKAPELPAQTLVVGCYYGMFKDDMVLTTAPELPALVLAPYCYSNMFRGTDGLLVPPALPATELENNCYNSMFWNSGIKAGPDLPAKILKDFCYSGMFYGCESLTSVKVDVESCILKNSFALPTVYWLNGTARNTTGVLQITDEAALDDLQLLLFDGMLPDNWKINKFGIHANNDPTPGQDGNYYSTFYNIHGDFAVPDGTTAYTGHVDQEDGSYILRMKAVANGIIPSGEAVVLKSNSPEYILTLTDTNLQKDEANDLSGTSTAQSPAPENCYIFSYGQNGLGFYKYAAGKSLAAHKAFLIYEKQNDAKGFRMAFEGMNDGIDGIESLTTAQYEGENAYYNLSGQRLGRMQKGINIVGGKKIIVK